jgi:hypothetical protein
MALNLAVNFHLLESLVGVRVALVIVVVVVAVVMMVMIAHLIFNYSLALEI